MGIKSEKTFEEVVERLVAVFRPQQSSRSDADAGNADRPAAPTQDNPSAPPAPGKPTEPPGSL